MINLEHSIINNIYLEENFYRELYNNFGFSFIQEIIKKIEHFYLYSVLDGKSYSDNIRSITGKGCYKIRFSPSQRIPFKLYHENNQLCVKLGKIISHKEGEQLHKKGYNFLDDYEKYEIKENTLSVEPLLNNEYQFSPIYRIWSREEEERLRLNIDADMQLLLNKTQMDFIESPGPILLKGTAGSGKTLVSIYRILKSSSTNRIYLTYTPQLREHAEKIYLSVTVGLKTQDITFSTIQYLLLDLLKDTKDFSFYIPNKMTYEIFKSLPFIQEIVRKSKIESYIIWEEIIGVLKQFESIPTRKTYLDLVEDKKSGTIVYDVYHKYVDYLESNKMWDDIDLAFTALNFVKTSPHPFFNEIIVDEIQDLTKIHFKLLTYLVNSPDGLFLVGDESQAIHPSKFEWEEVQKIICTNVNSKGKKLSKSYQYLTENYRTPESILKLAKELKNWQCQIMGEENHFKNIITHKKGGEAIHLIEPSCFDNFKIEIAPTNVMIIVNSEEYKEEARDKFGKGSVLTIYEAKGLENKDIVLYRFFDEHHINHALVRLRHFFKVKSKARDYKTLLNFLYVAITRSEQRLFIISRKENIQSIEPLENFPFDDNDGTSLKRIVKTQVDDPKEYFIWARKLELAGALEQAEANYEKSASLGYRLGKLYASKCRGLLAKNLHNYQKAVDCFEIALDTNEISILYELYECKGFLALEHEDLETAIQYFSSAKIPIKQIIQILLSTNNPERFQQIIELILDYYSAIDVIEQHNKASEFILQNTISVWDLFIADHEKIKNVSLSLIKMYQYCNDCYIVYRYLKQNFNYYKKSTQDMLKSQKLKNPEEFNKNKINRIRNLNNNLNALKTNEINKIKKNLEEFKDNIANRGRSMTNLEELEKADNNLKKIKKKYKQYETEFEKLINSAN